MFYKNLYTEKIEKDEKRLESNTVQLSKKYWKFEAILLFVIFINLNF
jgi:hypothetical protein